MFWHTTDKKFPNDPHFTRQMPQQRPEQYFKLPAIEQTTTQRPLSRVRVFGNTRTSGYTGHVPGLSYMDESIGSTYVHGVESALRLSPHKHKNSPVWDTMRNTMPIKKLGEGISPGFTGHIPGIYAECLHGHSQGRLAQHHKVMAAKFTPWTTISKEAYVNFYPSDVFSTTLPADWKVPDSESADPMGTMRSSSPLRRKAWVWVTDKTTPQLKIPMQKATLRKKIWERRSSRTPHKAFVWFCKGVKDGISYDDWCEKLQELGMGYVLREKDVVDLFDHLDENKDGVIDFREFCTLMD